MDQFLSWIAGFFAAVVPGLGAAPPPAWSGYVEADYVYVGAVTPGPIELIAVKEGDLVRKGDVLFTLASVQQEAARRSAAAQVASAEASWRNLTTGARPEELAAAAAAVEKAQTDFDLAQTTLARSQSLYASNTIPRAQLDRDAATAATALAALNQAKAQLGVLSLPAREEQQKAAEAALEAARANAEKAVADLADRTMTAPVAARVDRIYYDPGEMAGTGPVVSLLPSGALKVKFFVSEADRQALGIGVPVRVACDGCAPGLTAEVSYLDSQPQHTPPIIYSRDERSRLVFLVEARLADAAGILPGQPVSVERAQ